MWGDVGHIKRVAGFSVTEIEDYDGHSGEKRKANKPKKKRGLTTA